MASIYWIPRHYIRNFCHEHGQCLSGRILDFGCGSRPYMACFPDAREYIGVDYDSNLEIGSCYVKNNIYYYDGHNLPFPDNAFDAIVTFQVIEHVDNLHHSLQELQRVASPGATVLITGPLLWPEHETPHDFRRFTRWGIQQYVQRAGFLVEKVQPLGSVYDVLCVLLLDYLNTHRSFAVKKAISFLCPVINLISVVLNKLDPWAQRSDRYCYLDIAVIATKPI
jgi:SAM-dependent methyltransferase